jgi:DNA-binding MarR family transcriptional regulator
LSKASVTNSTNSTTNSPTLSYLVGRADRVLRRAMNEVLASHSVSLNQYTTLSVLERRGGLSNAQLARRSLVSPQSMNEVLLTLEQRGLVRRRPHPEHGRILQAQVTAKGRKLLTACEAEVAALEERMVRAVSPEDRRTLRTALLECVHALDGGLLGR